MSDDNYVKQRYDVPNDIGRYVHYRDRTGVIAEIHGNYVNANFYDKKPGHIEYIHPTDPNLTYGAMGGVIRKMTRSQLRYREYLRSETSSSFGEWLKYERYPYDMKA
jgi:hypothetical protein